MIPKPAGHRRRRRLEGGVNLAPLLDAVLNLIFFFLLATSLKREDVALEVNLPGSGTLDTPVSEKIPTLAVDEKGAMYFQGRPRTPAELELELAGLVRAGTRSVNIRSDEGADFGRVFELWEICRRAGIEEVMTNARRAESAPAPKDPRP